MVDRRPCQVERAAFSEETGPCRPSAPAWNSSSPFGISAAGGAGGTCWGGGRPTYVTWLIPVLPLSRGLWTQEAPGESRRCPSAGLTARCEASMGTRHLRGPGVPGSAWARACLCAPASGKATQMLKTVLVSAAFEGGPWRGCRAVGASPFPASFELVLSLPEVGGAVGPWLARPRVAPERAIEAQQAT